MTHVVFVLPVRGHDLRVGSVIMGGKCGAVLFRRLRSSGNGCISKFYAILDGIRNPIYVFVPGSTI